jgi:hypothetical protein
LQCFPSIGSIDHKRRAIEICRKSPYEALQRSVPDEYEHGRAQGEEGPGLAITGRVNQGQGGHHRKGVVVEDDQAEKSKGWPMAEE